MILRLVNLNLANLFCDKSANTLQICYVTSIFTETLHFSPKESHVDGNGYFTEHCGYDLEGKFIFDDGNEAVIDILKRRNTLVRTYNFVHSYPYDWRTKKPIFVTTSRYFKSCLYTRCC